MQTVDTETKYIQYYNGSNSLRGFSIVIFHFRHSSLLICFTSDTPVILIYLMMSRSHNFFQF